MGKELLIAKDLKQYFPIGKDRFVRAVDGVNFSINEGEVMGLVGESGSGKSTIAYTVMGMYRQTDGEIIFNGQTITNKTKGRSKDFRRDAQIVFQDPGSSLNPYQDVRQILSLPLRVHNVVPKDGIDDKIREILQMVELPPEFMYKTPNSIGGGERQLVSIARALCSQSEIIFWMSQLLLWMFYSGEDSEYADEAEGRAEADIMFITHDMGVMRNVSTKIAIMYLGKICEIAPTKTFYEAPMHPYTQMLLQAIPVVTPEEEALKPKKVKSEGEIPSPVNVPSGCSFHTRCAFKQKICMEVDPEMQEVEPGHFVRCHLCGKCKIVIQRFPNAGN